MSEKGGRCIYTYIHIYIYIFWPPSLSSRPPGVGTKKNTQRKKEINRKDFKNQQKSQLKKRLHDSLCEFPFSKKMQKGSSKTLRLKKLKARTQNGKNFKIVRIRKKNRQSQDILYVLLGPLKGLSRNLRDAVDDLRADRLF